MDNVVKSVGKLGAALANPAIARDCVAGSTGLEPAASGVTGRRSDQLSYRSLMLPVAGIGRTAHDQLGGEDARCRFVD